MKRFFIILFLMIFPLHIGHSEESKIGLESINIAGHSAYNLNSDSTRDLFLGAYFNNIEHKNLYVQFEIDDKDEFAKKELISNYKYLRSIQKKTIYYIEGKGFEGVEYNFKHGSYNVSCINLSHFGKDFTLYSDFAYHRYNFKFLKPISIGMAESIAKHAKKSSSWKIFFRVIGYKIEKIKGSRYKYKIISVEPVAWKFDVYKAINEDDYSSSDNVFLKSYLYNWYDKKSSPKDGDKNIEKSDTNSDK